MAEVRTTYRCLVTGAKVTPDTFVCEVVDKWNLVGSDAWGISQLYDRQEDDWVPMVAATCRSCSQLGKTERTVKGG